MLGCVAACSQTESEGGLRVLDEVEGEKRQRESEKAQAEQEESWLGDFVKGLDENGLVGEGLVRGRGIFSAGVVVEAGVLVL